MVDHAALGLNALGTYGGQNPSALSADRFFLLGALRMDAFSHSRSNNSNLSIHI